MQDAKKIKIVNASGADIGEHVNWFKKYAAQKTRSGDRDPEPMNLKLRHSLNVLRRAEKIVREDGLEGDEARAILLAALYHDTGRFDQYLTYGTFKDADSRNHARLSLTIVKREKRLAEEKETVVKLAQTAIGLHNRHRLPPGLNGAIRAVCDAVRDADKLDIISIMAAHLSGPGPYNPTVVLSLPDRDDTGSRKVVEAALAGRVASYGDLITVNDFRVLLASWYFEMSFVGSRRMFRGDGAARELAEGLPNNELYGDVRAFLLATLRAEGD